MNQMSATAQEVSRKSVLPVFEELNGLLEMSRQRLRPSLGESSGIVCSAMLLITSSTRLMDWLSLAS